MPTWSCAYPRRRAQTMPTTRCWATTWGFCAGPASRRSADWKMRTPRWTISKHSAQPLPPAAPRPCSISSASPRKHPRCMRPWVASSLTATQPSACKNWQQAGANSTARRRANAIWSRWATRIFLPPSARPWRICCAGARATRPPLPCSLWVGPCMKKPAPAARWRCWKTLASPSSPTPAGACWKSPWFRSKPKSS